MDLKGNEFAIRFADQTLIIESNSPINAMLINGFNRYKNEIANFSIWDFDKRDGYLGVFDLNDIRTRHVQRIDQVRNNWIDPITEDILIEMQYPIETDEQRVILRFSHRDVTKTSLNLKELKVELT